jgi:tRNA A-37 threonylcarbamoyl transferase component Bud32/tetratricopeptide (TPR) repeat protein
MTDPQRWRRVSELFEAALDMPPGARTEWLRDQHLADPTILPEVEQLLVAHERADGILDRARPDPMEAPTETARMEPGELSRRLDGALAGKYRIVRQLGQGGMAVVFLAWERKHDRRVVMKVMRPEIAARLSADRFAREVKLAARLSHPHIVGLIDSGEADGFLYYVMPHVDGESLRSVMRREGKLEVGQAVSLLRDVARALAHAHSAGVVHRDLKPANVLVAGHHAYLLDFGVAKSFEADGGDDPLTRTGDAIGTPRYMAPEQLAGLADTDHRVDIYAWGQLAHEMLAGRTREIESSDLGGDAVARGVAEALRSVRPDVPITLARLVGRCLEVRPDRRVASADEILTVLDEGITGEGTSGRLRRHVQVPGARLRRYVPVLLAGGAVVAAALLAVSLRSQGTSGTVPGPVEVEAVTEALGMPIAVAAFANETGDPSLDVIGRLIGNWISEGLVRADVGAVVPWPSSLEAAESAARLATDNQDFDPVSSLAAGTGANTVVTGSYYEVGGKISFRAEVVDARDGRVVSATDAVSAPRDSIETAMSAVRERVMGSIAMGRDARLPPAAGLLPRPPTFAAYRAFDRGLGLYLQSEYTSAVPELLRAWEIDPEFYDAPLLAVTNLFNIGTSEERARADSLVEVLREHRSEFGELQDLRWQYARALLDSDGSAALQAARRAAVLTSASRTSYNAAHAAVTVGKPGLAVEILKGMDPNSGPLREWLHYWTVLAHALHMEGDHEAELEATREMRQRFPERRIGSVFEARALAATGRTSELETLLKSLAGLSPNVYWSQGAAMVVSGEELKAHGWPREGDALLRRGRDWLVARLRENPGFRQHRYWLGSALYDLEEFEQAGVVFAELARDFPERNTYRGLHALCLARSGEPDRAMVLLDEGFEYSLGDRTALLARISAIRGDPARAVSLLSVAFQQGFDGAAWLHASAQPDLRLMESDPRFAAVMLGESR